MPISRPFYLIYLISLAPFLACHHMVPLPAKKMPFIKVMHQGNIESMALERYVASVLAGEVHASWPLEALKAQAIAARTFALLRMRERRDNSYHIKNSVMEQVVKSKVDPIFIKASRESAGLVLTFDGELAETSFHSTCGGKTTNAKSVWGRAYPHLVGSLCGFCQSSPTYSWQIEIPLSEIEAKFLQKISEIEILSRTSDGRTHTIVLIGPKRKVMGGHDFRMALGPMRIKSTLIKEIKVNGSKVSIKGNGFGHGVGLCQYGAKGMANAGESFQQILTHYYPGTKLKKLY
jgi:stage II sporulation protein D